LFFFAVRLRFNLVFVALVLFTLLFFVLAFFAFRFLAMRLPPAFVPGIANYVIRVSFGTEESLADAKLVGCVPQNFTPHRKKQAECEKECFLLVPKRLGD
jgi:hypothetical protein